ncbi:MAG: hypothetical protein Q8P01_01575 [bacterium]|nr:hypothetical protein [bacterium]
MKHVFGKTVVVALGGSVMFPDEIDPVRSPMHKRIGRRLGRLTSNGIDSQFLKSFRAFILNQIRRSHRRFIIVAGGGRIARVYQKAAGEIVSVKNDDKDWLGIHATRCNAHLLRTIFREQADPVVLDTRGKIKRLRYPVTIASGWRPGNSTDFVAMALAVDFPACRQAGRASELVIMGKPEYVYDKDPQKFPGAKPFQEMRWKAYRRLVPKRWVPGAGAPVDPIAARLGEEKGVKTFVVGKDLKNFQNLLVGREARGTVVF